MSASRGIAVLFAVAVALGAGSAAVSQIVYHLDEAGVDKAKEAGDSSIRP